MDIRWVIHIRPGSKIYINLELFLLFFYLLYLYHIKMGPFPTQQTSFYIDLENFFYAFIDLFLIFMGFIE